MNNFQPWLVAEMTDTNKRVLVDAHKLETNFNVTLKWFPLGEYSHW